MFTGIIQARGELKEVIRHPDSLIFWIEAPQYFSQMQKGDSLAVNGVCLTLEDNQADKVRVTAIRETLAISALEALIVGDFVNLEKAATLQTALGGHMVSGHVDGCARVTEIIPMEMGKEIWLELPENWDRYTITKGSIALDGISLTIAEKKGTLIRVALIPETLERTSAGTWKIGEPVHFEVDQVAKYVENFVIPKGE